MFTDKTDNSLACACDCWLQGKPSTGAMQRLVRRINPDWVGCLEVQCGSHSVDHHFCRWFAVAFISFTLATAPSFCGWRLIARQHMVPSASDHSTTCLSNCVCPYPQPPPAAAEKNTFWQAISWHTISVTCMLQVSTLWDCCRANVTRCSLYF